MARKQDNLTLMGLPIFYLLWIAVAWVLFISRATFLGALINSYLIFLMPGFLLARFAIKGFSGFERIVLSYTLGQAILLIIFKTIGYFVGIENLFIWSTFYFFFFLALISTKWERGLIKQVFSIISKQKKLVVFYFLLFGSFLGFVVFQILVNGVYDFQGNLKLARADFGLYEAMAMTNEILRRNLHFPFEIPQAAGLSLNYPWGSYFNVALLSKLNQVTILTSWKVFSLLNVIHLFIMIAMLFKRLLRPLQLNAYVAAVLIFIPFFHLLVYYSDYFVDFQSRGTGHLIYVAFLLTFFYSTVNNLKQYIILGMLAGLIGAYTPKPAISLYLATVGYIFFCMFRSFKLSKAYLLRKILIIFSILVIWFISGGDIFIKYFFSPRLHVDVGDKWLVVNAIATVFFLYYPLYFFSGICFITYLRGKIKSLNYRLVVFSFMSIIGGISSGFLVAADASFPKQIPGDLASISSNVVNFMVINLGIIFYISLYYAFLLLSQNTQEFSRIIRSKSILLINIFVFSLGIILGKLHKLRYDWVPIGEYNYFIYLMICLMFILFYASLAQRRNFVYAHIFLVGILLVSPYIIRDTMALVKFDKGFIRFFRPEITVKNKEIKLVNWIDENIPKDSIFIGSYIGFDRPNAIMAFSQCRMFLAYTWTLSHQTNYNYSERVRLIEKVYNDSIFDIEGLEKFNLDTYGYALFFDFKRDLRKNYEELKEKYNKQLEVRYEDDNFAILYYKT